MKRTTKSFCIGLTLSTSIFLTIGVMSFLYVNNVYLPSRDLALESSWIENQNQNGSTAYKLVKALKRGEVLTMDHLIEIEIPSAIHGTFIYSDEISETTLEVCRDLDEGMILYKDMVYNPKDIESGLRVFEISEAVMPLTLQKGEAVDVRISFPSGLDYIVLSKKEVKGLVRETNSLADVPENQGTQLSRPQMILLHLNAQEILVYSSALVDAFFKQGTYLYVTPYVSSEFQASAIVNYPCNEAVQSLMLKDPNVVNRAKLALSLEQRAFLNSSLMKINTDVIRPLPKTIQGAPDFEQDKPMPSLSDLDN